MEQLKKCTKCKEDKPYSAYGKKTKGLLGLQGYCKICKSKVDKEYRDDPKRYRELLNKKSEYYHKVKNEDWFKNYCKNRVRDYKKEMASLKANPHKEIKSKLRKMTCGAFNRRNNPEWVKKGNKTEELLGTDFFTVREFLERQFLKGMTWDNYGTLWNIDHVIPLDVAGDNVELINKLCYYQNLSPVWKKDNFRKGFKVPNICTLWENPIVPYKVTDIVITPRYDGIVVEKYKLVIESGERYGKLTIIGDAEPKKVKTTGNEKRMMRCECDCGNKKDISLNSLRQGTTVSCGCEQLNKVKEYFKKNPKRHFTNKEIDELKILVKDIPKGSSPSEEVVKKFEGRTYEQLIRVLRDIRNNKI
jgi:hypothetical protein